MSNIDFDLNNSRWYTMMKLGLACKAAQAAAQIITQRAPVLARFDYEPTIGTALADAEMALVEALHAVKHARKTYEKNTKPALVAAE